MLLFEQVIESAPRVRRICGRDCRNIPTSAGIPGFALDGCLRSEKLASIADVFFRDPFGNRFSALKTSARVKVLAVLTGMEVSLALWALTVELDVDRRRNNHA